MAGVFVFKEQAAYGISACLVGSEVCIGDSGSIGASSGFLGVIIGGWAADWLRQRNPSGRVLVIIFGAVAPVPAVLIAFTTESLPPVYALLFPRPLYSSEAADDPPLCDLVRPRTL